MTNQRIFQGFDLLNGNCHSIKVEGENIISRDKLDTDVQTLPLIIPSFIDLQVNGFRGFNLNESSLRPKTVEGLSNALCSVGVQSYFPTLITTSESNFVQRLEAISQAVETLPKSKDMIAGIHLEGPAISYKDGPRGAHPKEHIRPASRSEFERLQKAANGLIKLITIAPETEKASSFIEYVTAKGIIVSLGHSDSDELEITQAVDAGAQMSTHLGNGVAVNLKRHPNIIWAQLAEDRLMASFLADSHHLPKSTLKSMLRAKGVGLSILVSDSVMFAGLPAGRYSSEIGGEVDVSDEGRVSIVDTSYLAGSGSCLLDIIAGFNNLTGMSLRDAVIMACSNPAKLIGLKNDLVVGAQANFILLNYDYTSKEVSVNDIIFKGKSVHAC